ncbi:MAG: OsmC family protein [Bdellovibrionales bacterium]|nr:OsmC family protein [Bdellovibrionales bacterium]
MIQYPLHFSVSGQASSGMGSPWDTSVPSGKLTAAIPPEFNGPGGGYSPEDFFALAAINCFIATFKVIAEKSKLQFESLSADGRLTVDRNDSGVPMMKFFSVKATIQGVTDRERALRLLEKTSQSCLVMNSIKTEKTFEFLVN